MKFGRVVLWDIVANTLTERQTDGQTDTLITIPRSSNGNQLQRCTAKQVTTVTVATACIATIFDRSIVFAMLHSCVRVPHLTHGYFGHVSPPTPSPPKKNGSAVCRTDGRDP